MMPTRSNRFVERIMNSWTRQPMWDWLIAGVLTGLYLWLPSLLDVDPPLEQLTGVARRNLYLTLAAIAGSLLGFAIAAMSILVGLGGKRIRIVRQSAQGQMIPRIFAGSIRALAAATLILIVAYIQESDVWQWMSVFVTTIALARLTRLSWILHWLVNLSDDASP
jgi:hypothetical protein